MSESAAPLGDTVDVNVLLGVLAQVHEGDFTARMPLDWTGVAGKIADSLNDVIIANQALGSELARVSDVVGKQGRLSQRVVLGGHTQSWSGSIESVNSLIDDLVRPTIEMQRVIGAVADGDLSKKMSSVVQGEMLELKNTINAMVDQLNGFISEVTRVTREVGVEGKLGGQAQSKEVAGVWKDLTDNVNQLAANLTNQVRAISEVATAVTEGDLTRQVRVEASGEVAVLKDKLNEMIRNLRETTRQNVEQDWLKTNRERFTRMLQGQDDLAAVSSMILSELATLVAAQHGVFYSITGRSDDDDPVLELQAGYGYEERRHLSTSFRLGEGLVGQCAKEKKRILLTDVPGDYVRINSGLGESPPLNIIVLPVLFEGSLRAVIELASFSAFSIAHQTFLDSVTESIGIVLSTIEAAARTETLLKQSQSQAEELRSQQQELRESNEDLGRQATLLAEQNILAEQKNQEVEESKRLVEEKVSQLAVSSKYKSEFIANMSHELRTPLNSLLILAQQLEDNPDKNMTDAQVEYASVIYTSGMELLDLLNSILDLAKVESGTATAHLTGLFVGELRTNLLREFTPVAEGKGLGFTIDLAPDCPASIISDQQRLGQILKNLLSNAFKFTERGAVHLQVGLADRGWSGEVEALRTAVSVLALAVTDTGIGIDTQQQQRIFEAFAQGDGTTARLYGGTGLGLSISRELVALLGGELTVTSAPGEGSTFTVYLPVGGLATLAPVAPIRPGTVAGRSIPSVVRAPRMPLNTGLKDRVSSITSDHAPLAGTTVLVIDDDLRNIFAMTALLERSHADVTIAESGAEALALLEEMPDFDIVLMDIMMPQMDGYATIRAIRKIDRFASLAIIAVTGKATAGERQRCLDAGANDYVPKPVDTAELFAALRPWLPGERGTAGVISPERLVALDETLVGKTRSVRVRRSPLEHVDVTIDGVKILVVDDDLRNIFAMTALLERGRADVTVAESGAEALAILSGTAEFDIVLMDIMMPVMDGYDTIRAVRRIDRFAAIPIIAVTGKATAGERQRCIDAGANDYLPKPVSGGDLLVALGPWLPAVPSTGAAAISVLAAVEEPVVEGNGHRSGRGKPGGQDYSAIDGVKVLVVDDDLRNIFAMTALLKRGHADVTIVESGADALAALEQIPDMDIVLMDIMMPVMDGYDTIRAIRRIDHFKSLPVIAVTSKATAGERQRCLDAGATDYVPKPVDTAELIAALRPWLPATAQPSP